MDWWNVAFIAVAIATLLATIIIGYYTLVINKKKIDFFIISQSSLINIEEEYKNDLQILYRGQEIEEAVVTVLRICNSGNQAIKVEDFSRPISLLFEDKSDIFDVKIIDSSPKNLRMSISFEGNTVTFEKILFNSKDSIDISLITSSFEKPTVDTRIIGIKRVEVLRDIEDSFLYKIIKHIDSSMPMIGILLLIFGFIILVLTSIIKIIKIT